MSDTRKQLESIREKHNLFNPDQYQTILDSFSKEAHIVLTHANATPNKVDFVGVSLESDEKDTHRNYAVYFDIIWVENNKLNSMPVKLTSCFI